jgi:ribosomal protein S6--L-glutamate ligase
MRLCWLLERGISPVPSLLLIEVMRLLAARGFRSQTVIPEETHAQVDMFHPEADLYLLKSRTELGLSLAGALHDLGACLVDPYQASVTAQNKVTAAGRLRRAGVPTPRTWATGNPASLANFLDTGPLVVKPHLGYHGEGVVVVSQVDELRCLGGPVVVQEYVAGPNEDLKVYVVADEVFAVRKPFGPDSFTRPGRQVRVSQEIRKIALQVGEAFGLGLFGIDVIEGRDGPVVVDVNYFPGYRGVPEIAPRIASYIANCARADGQGVP